MAIKYIEKNINTIDHHYIFYNIYANHKDYDMMDSEYCKNYLITVFEEVYDKQIDLNLITNIENKLYPSKSDKQTKFRNDLIERFKCCILSDAHYDSCEASHIKDLKYEPLNFDINNGLLLSATLHKEFDNLKWCIDPDTYDIVISKKFEHQCLGINKYKNINLNNIFIMYPMMTMYLRFKYEIFFNENKI